MRILFTVQIFLTLGILVCSAQNASDDGPIEILEQRWERVTLRLPKQETAPVMPAKMQTPDEVRQRTMGQPYPRGAEDPRDYTIEARSAAIEKNVQNARSGNPPDVAGFLYSLKLKNKSDRKIEVVFWEYRFTEFANASNVVRRQFLCVSKMKPGEKLELFGVSTLGPSEVISADSLKDVSEKLFDEKIFLNRIEFSDGAILQRRDWKMAEVEASVKKATSAPWGKEVCKML